MTQAIIDNARNISFDRQAEFATSASVGGQFQYFQKGPILSRLNVDCNVLRQATWLDIRADLANNKLGPYSITLPSTVVGPVNTNVITVNGASQTDNTIAISGVASTTVLNKGDLIRFADVNGSYTVLTNVVTDASGDAIVTLDFPVAAAPADNAAITINTGITFSMHLVSRGVASQLPGIQGLVALNGQFTYVEEF